MKILKLTKRDLLKYFDSRSYSRGFSYYQQGRVLKFDLYESAEALWLIRARVKGTHTYKQHIELGYDPRGELWMEAECDCPVGYNCKHCAAVLFYAMNKESRLNQNNTANIWLDDFMKIHSKEKLPLYNVESEYFLIIRLYRDANNDFDFCKAKMLKNGLVSKGTKISVESMVFNYERGYQYSYLTKEDRNMIKKLSSAMEGSYYNPEYRFRDEYGAFLLKMLAKSG